MSADPAGGGSPEAARWLAREVEALPGVRAVSVSLAGERQLGELRVRVAAGAAPAIVANAAGQLLRHAGFDFNPGAIRVLPDEGDPDDPAEAALRAGERAWAPAGGGGGAAGTTAVAEAPAAAPTRTSSSGGARCFLLADLAIHRSGPRVTCTVRVRRGSAEHEGSGEELDSEAGRARAGARGALDAAARALDGVAFGLEGAALVDLFARRHVAVSVEAAAGRRVATLAGMVPVDPARSLEEAGALAALRAIERWVSG